jgi:hypothetical protein
VGRLIFPTIGNVGSGFVAIKGSKEEGEFVIKRAQFSSTWRTTHESTFTDE